MFLPGLVHLQKAKNMPSRKNNKPLYLAVCSLMYLWLAHQYDASSANMHYNGAIDDKIDDKIADKIDDAVHITRIIIMISRPSVLVEITSCP